MVALERGAVYRPGFRRDGQAVAAPDEDEFTMAAMVVELLDGPVPASASTGSVHLVGNYSPVVDWGLTALLGRPVEVVRHASGIEGLREALVHLRKGGTPDSPLLVVVGLPERSPLAAKGGAGEAAAVALRFGPGAMSVDVPSPDEAGAIGAARTLLATLPSTAVVDGSPAAPRPAVPYRQVQPFVEADPGALSQGAYVPRARYLENLPSRWRLEGIRCARCGARTFPARSACRSCGAEEGLSREALPRDGARVVAATTIGKGGQPTEFDAQVEGWGEYSVVLAEFAPGVRLTLQVTDAVPGEIQIGSTIGTRLRRLYPMEGEWRYGRKAVPLPSGGAPG